MLLDVDTMAALAPDADWSALAWAAAVRRSQRRPHPKAALYNARYRARRAAKLEAEKRERRRAQWRESKRRAAAKGGSP